MPPLAPQPDGDFRAQSAGRLIALLGIAFIVISSLTAQGAEGKEPASHVCFMDGCFDDYIVSLNRASSGIIIVKTRHESHCYSGSNCTFKPSESTYAVRCTNPGGYIEPSTPGDPYMNQRTPEPERDPPHATQAAKQLWAAVCSGRAAR
jgi:hypothetical protein